MLTGFATPMISPFSYGTSPGTSDVPGRFAVAIDGRPFNIDQKVDFQNRRFSINDIDVIKQQADTSGRPGETTINPNGPWRRSQESWHLGAGQTFVDRADSSDFRFRSSKGIDVSTEWEISLLNDTNLPLAVAHTNLKAIVVGDHFYYIDNQKVYWTTDLTAPTDSVVKAGDSDTTVLDITSDGYNLYAVVGDGIHTSTRGATTWTHLVNQPTSRTFLKVFYVKGRLIALTARGIYEITAAGLPTAPTVLFEHANTDFTWVDVAEGPDAIYFAGYSGQSSFVYSVTITPEGTALAKPIIACELPIGEIVYSINIYQGQVHIGIQNGIHLGELTSSNAITLGATIPTPNPVRAFYNFGQFTWYSWSNYDTSSTGLGRLNLRYDTSANSSVPIPSYVSDIMYSGQGDILSIVKFNSKLVFAVSGIGYAAEIPDHCVVSGSIDSGLIGYDLTEDKVGLYLDTAHESPLVGSYTSYISADGGSFSSIGTKSATSLLENQKLSVGQITAELFEVREVLTADTTSHHSPVVRRETLFIIPTSSNGYEITLPLILGFSQVVADGDFYRSASEDFYFLKNLRESSRPITIQVVDMTFAGTVENIIFNIMAQSPENGNGEFGTEGTCIVTCRTI